VKVSIDHSVDREEVLRFLESNPKATFFHTPAWMEILSNSFPSFTAYWITARAGSTLVGFLPFIGIKRGPFRTLWALPFGTYGDPISNDPNVARRLLDTFFGMASRPLCMAAEMDLLFTEPPRDLPRGVSCRTEECRLIELGGSFEDFRSKRVSRKRRQLCNKALKAGVEVRRIEDRGGLGEIYEAYRIESSAWGGVHPYPLAFFKELFSHRGQGVVILGGYIGDEFLGGHIDFYFGKTGQAWQACLTARAVSFEISAVLILEAVEEAYRRGVGVFNLGSSSGSEGIRFFKESLGGREHLYSILKTDKRWYRAIKGR
jgi:hypothetical protein